jgi:nucleotide-binding universal stress UspA family protein
MFGKILHANDGSEHAFRALAVALAIAKQNRSELHIVCVEEIPYLPEFMEEVLPEPRHGIFMRYSSALAAWQNKAKCTFIPTS